LRARAGAAPPSTQAHSYCHGGRTAPSPPPHDPEARRARGNHTAARARPRGALLSGRAAAPSAPQRPRGVRTRSTLTPRSFPSPTLPKQPLLGGTVGLGTRLPPRLGGRHGLDVAGDTGRDSTWPSRPLRRGSRGAGRCHGAAGAPEGAGGGLHARGRYRARGMVGAGPGGRRGRQRRAGDGDGEPRARAARARPRRRGAVPAPRQPPRRASRTAAARGCATEQPRGAAQPLAHRRSAPASRPAGRPPTPRRRPTPGTPLTCRPALQLSVHGMTCGACTSAVEAAIGWVAARRGERARVGWSEGQSAAGPNRVRGRQQRAPPPTPSSPSPSRPAPPHSALPGVACVQASLLQHSAEVDFDPAVTPAEALVAAAEDAGFDASLLEVARAPGAGGGAANGGAPRRGGGGGGPVPRVARLAVGGMTCAACSGAVERALGAVPGVERAGVALAQGEAEVGRPRRGQEGSKQAVGAGDSRLRRRQAAGATATRGPPGKTMLPLHPPRRPNTTNRLCLRATRRLSRRSLTQWRTPASRRASSAWRVSGRRGWKGGGCVGGEPRGRGSQQWRVARPLPN
jgi:copper chaperone CopZ